MTDDIHDQPTGAGLPGDADFDVEFRESFEAVLDRFEAAWQSGEPDIAEYAAARPGDDALVVELCLVDREHRRQRGLPESLEDYAGRFPAVADRLRNLAGISLADAAAREGRAVTDLVGREIGDVTIVRLIGEGGMGRVYEGRQRKPRRPVAVKVMQPGVASPALLRRFEYEAQVLARLQHPGIAHIYAIGTHEVNGQAVPYFVMEYIPNAKTLTQYAEENKLSTHDRLELFQKVCDAVAHGHQKGVIHRDLKPANVVVDSTGQPKVIDFGVAKATDSDLALTTMQTDVGAIIGTLQYMSPEQFDADPDDLDVRLDVYALGVVLYELLTGKPPYDVKRKAIYEVARVVREEEPTPITSLDKTLRRDVAVIAGKCLEKDRDRRYSSAAELAGDVGRYLAGEPITAAQPSLWDGVLRLARRHKAAAAAVAGVAASLVAAVVGISAFALRAERARETAVKARAATEQLLRVTTAQRLAVASQQAQTAGFMPRSILLGVAAVKSTTRFNEPVVPEAEQALRTALEKMPHGTRHTLGSAVALLVASPEPVEVTHRLPLDIDAPEPYDPTVFPLLDDPRPARWLFAACNDGTLHACDLLRQPRTMQRIERGVGLARALAVSADERWLAAGLSDGTVRVWDLTGASPQARHDLAPPAATAVLCMAIGPDGRRLAAGYESGAIRLWDLSEKDPARTSWVLQGHTKSVRSLQIDPDARLLASEGHDGTIHIWDLMQSSAHAAVQTLKPKSEHADAGRSLAFGRRSRLLASKGPRLWDLAAGESAEAMDLDSGASDVFFTSFDRWLLGVSYGGACAWDLGDPDENEPAPRSKPRPYRFGVEDANFLIPSASPSGCYLAAGRTVRHWKLPYEPDDEPTPAEEVYCGHDSDVRAIAVSHDETCLFTGDEDGVVQIWDLKGSTQAGQADFTLPLENWQLKDASPSASPCLSADHRWLFVNRDPRHDWRMPPTDRALDLSCDPPRPVVLDVTASNTKPPSRDPGVPPEPGTDGRDTPITAASFCSHGNMLVTAVTTPQSNRIVGWTLTQSATASPRTLVADCGKEAPQYVLASPDLRWLVSSDMQQALTLWNLQRPGPPAGRVIDGAAFYIAAYPSLLEFSPDGRWLVIAGGDALQRLLLFDLDGKPEAALDLRPHDLTRFAVRRNNVLKTGQFTCSTFSPDSRWLFVSDLGGNVYRIDLQADRLLDSVVGANIESASVRQVKFSPDGLWIACSLDDNRVGLWDSRTFSSTARPTLLVGHEDSISCLAFGAGHQLASGSIDKTVRLWKLAPLQHGKAPDCQVFAAGDRVKQVGFTADGKVLNAVTSEGIRGWRLGIDVLIPDALRRVGRDLTADERAQYGIDYALEP